MSKHQIWVLVEGPFDRSFYDKLCHANPYISRLGFNVSTLSDMTELAADGKQSLLVFYRYLRGRSALQSVLANKKTCVLFMMDKDVDDIDGRKARSTHVIYTEYHSVENYAVRFGNIGAAISSAALLDLSSVLDRVGRDSLAWTSRAAQNWRPWVEYCLLVKKLKLSNTPSYAVHRSLMHRGAYVQLDEPAAQRLFERARQLSGQTPSEFETNLVRIRRCVAKLYSARRHDLVFKGKWYAHFLVEDAVTIAGTRRFARSHLDERIFACLVATLDFKGTWTSHLHQALMLGAEKFGEDRTSEVGTSGVGP